VIQGYARAPDGVHPPLASPGYGSTRLRAPSRPPLRIPPTPTEVTGPVFGHERVGPLDNDLTRQHEGEPIGQRIIVSGRVLDADGRPLPDTLIEVWQANASGRYRHVNDNWPGPLDPNFEGGGRAATDADGTYRFVTIRPGAYPWRNHYNAWRPAHIHFSVFGRSFSQRLVTQMYFPGDPLFFQDPILNSIPDEAARQRLVSRYDHDLTEPDWALGFRFDIVLRGPDATPFETSSGA
jgi:protocatechuate 3,4-dioxygenase beta subunit